MRKRVLLIASLLAKMYDFEFGERCTSEALVFHKDKGVYRVNEKSVLLLLLGRPNLHTCKEALVESYRTLINVD
jgi:hypothetical protein